MRKVCVQDIENISSCSFCLYPVVPIKLGKVIKYEAKKMMSNIYLETLNIEWGQIDHKHNRRVKVARVTPLLKKPSLDPTQVGNYRPVSLLTLLSKTIERAASKQVTE